MGNFEQSNLNSHFSHPNPHLISNYLTSFLVFILFFFLFAIPSFSADKDFVLNAKTIKYVDEGGYIEAVGSVEVFYKDITIEAEYLRYYSKSKQVYTDSGFNLKYGELNFSGQYLDFNIKDKTGSASDVLILFQNV